MCDHSTLDCMEFKILKKIFYLMAKYIFAIVFASAKMRKILAK